MFMHAILFKGLRILCKLNTPNTFFLSLYLCRLTFKAAFLCALLSLIVLQIKSMLMATLKVQGLLVLVVLVNSVFTVLEARPLSIIKEVNAGIRENVDVFDWLSLGSMKQSGPSAPGAGHKFTNSKTLGGIKNTGPSPGGGGHKFSNSQTFGDVKDSGPSSGGQGH